MSDIYVFSSDDENNDYSTMGLVGALEPTECTFEETANGDSIVTMTHPLDEFGKYTALQRDNILVIPVPVRTTPEIQNGSCVTQVWQYKVKPLNQLTSKNQRTLYKKSSGSGKKKIMNAGDVVTVVTKPRESQNISRWKVKSKYGTGWVDPNGFDLIEEKTIADKADAIEEIQSPWSVTDQLFRIQEVEKELTSVTVTARHISYDLLYDATYWYYGTENSTTLQNCIDRILADSYSRPTDTSVEGSPFRAYTNVANTQAGFSYRGKNPIECFLDPEEGVCAKFGVDLIRDNHDLYFLASPGVNRGVRIQYGKNLTGITYKDNTDEVVTRIIPTGEMKNGEELFLASAVKDQCIDSPKINDYPVIHVYYMKCENCKIGDKDENGGTITMAIARNRMRAQAQKLFESGVDEPKIEMSVEFINLGDTEEYSQFKDLENCFLFDYVLVQSPNISVDVTAQIVKIEWDCILDRMNSVEIGAVGKTLGNTGITSWQIPSGFSGGKIANGTVGSGSLKENIIAAKHIQSDTINADHIQANAVTADKIAANSITASKIAAGSVEADKIKAGAVTAEKIDAKAVTAEKIDANAIDADKIKAGAVTTAKLAAGSVTAEKIDAKAVTAEKIDANAIDADKIKAGAVTTAKLAAGSVTAEKIASKTITADLIAAKTITAESGVIDDAAIGGAQIADGSITAAKIVSLNADVINAGTLSAERLVLVGDDGVIYKINAASSGLSLTELSKDQYKNYINGTVIVAKSITAAQIAARTITGNEILAGSITAKEIDVSDLFASSATINALNAMDIRGNTYLQLYVTDAVDKVEVGGTNLFPNTEDIRYEMTSNSNAIAFSAVAAVQSYSVRASLIGQPITLSFTVNNPGDGQNVGNVSSSAGRFGMHLIAAWKDSTGANSSTKETYPCASALYVHNVANRRLSATSTLTPPTGYDALSELRLAVQLYWKPAANNAQTWFVEKPKLERGNKATDWSPAPEDFQNGIDDLDSRMTTTESQILQKADSITLGVLQTQVDNITVGGTNLLLGTKDFSNNASQPWLFLDAWETSGEYKGLTVLKRAASWSAMRQDISVVEGEIYTLSAYLKVDDGATDVKFYCDPPAGETGYGIVSPSYTAVSGVTSEWKRFSHTFTVTKSGRIRPCFTRTANSITAYLYICGLKLEKGNKATDWTPAPEDPAGSLSVSSDYSKVDINTQRVRIVSKQMEVAVPADDGEDDVMRVDADGVHAEVVEADQVVSDSVVSTQGAISYTPANGGALAAFLDDLSGKHLTGRVYIDCKNVSSGNYTVEKLSGEGQVTLANGTMNQLKIDSCGSTTVYALKVNFSNSGTALLLENSLAVFISGCVINASTGIVMGDSWPTRAVMLNCSGDCSVMASVNWTSELRIVGNGKPTGTLHLANGSEVYNATPDPTFAAASSPSIPTTQTVTVSLSPTNTYTLRGTSNSDGNKLYQGRYSSSQGMRKGVMLFTLPSDLTSASNIDSAVLTLRRISGAGQGGGVTTQVRCFDQTGTVYGSATAYGGQTVSIDVTSGVKAMKTNGYTGLMLYNPDTTLVSGKSYTKSYARFAGKGESGEPVLKISYRK